MTDTATGVTSTGRTWPLAPEGGAAGTLHRGRLGNGLRLLVAPDHTAPAVAVAVLYDVGHRSEPEGREGFAHLFEHLMFQGSGNLEKLAHARYINGCGGGFNGITHRDHTSFFEVVPSGALELVLFLEADRMRAPGLTEEALANQVAVVEQEIRRKVFDNPYGGLPSPYLPAVMFDDFANAHDGWGAAERLRTVTVEECWAFFKKYYTPANALLVVCGNAEPGLVEELAERHFGAIPGGVASPPRREPGPDTAQPTSHQGAPRHREHRRLGAAMPAMAAGWRIPDPARQETEYQAAVLLSEVLAKGPESILQRQLIQRNASVSQLSMTVGLGGSPYESRDPDVLALTMFLTGKSDPRAVLGTVYEELTNLAACGPTPEILSRHAAKWATAWARALDPLGVRAQRLGAFELLHGRAELALELPSRIRRVTSGQVAQAAAELAGQPQRWVTLLPETAHQTAGAKR
ncbi:M16 family metallopeptidase [Streptomyces griseorubiginosus]|uniref:M16 family metallopeptidase n=1 Tax=Streptomyces griseorubiginosus TaxID=67304 RepID=UPI0036E8A95E